MLKHFFASFCLKYLVPTISVISVTDLWSVIRIFKKGSIETLLRPFNTCQARQLLHGAVTWFCPKFEYNTTKSGFWGKLPLFNVISERYRTRLIYTILDIFWEWCKKIEVRRVQNRARHYNLAKPWLDTSLERHLRHSHLCDISINFLYDLYGKKLFPIISAPNIFTPSRDVKQWNKTLKMEKKVLKFEEIKIPEIRHLPTNHPPHTWCMSVYVCMHDYVIIYWHTVSVRGLTSFVLARRRKKLQLSVVCP